MFKQLKNPLVLCGIAILLVIHVLAAYFSFLDIPQFAVNGMSYELVNDFARMLQFMVRFLLAMEFCFAFVAGVGFGIYLITNSWKDTPATNKE